MILKPQKNNDLVKENFNPHSALEKDVYLLSVNPNA